MAMQVPRDFRRVIVAASVGNVIEWYDFYIFGSLAAVLSVKFFEKSHPVAALLSTVGVAVSTVLTGVAAHALLDLSWLEAFLLGAVVASTDAAAVFATLRFTHWSAATWSSIP